MAVRFRPGTQMGNIRAGSSAVEQFPLKEKVRGPNPLRLTKKEIESEVGAALAAPAFADSAAKAKFKFAESRRKKNEEKRKNFKGLYDFFLPITRAIP